MLQDKIFLTDHGPNHTETVIQRAGELLADPAADYPQLTAYEVYLLLMAILFHDVGNLYGRDGHEDRQMEIMDHMGILVGDETVERAAISKIARAHGGKRNGDRDTIRELPREDWILGKMVRYQALAAILRFADELADDSRRAARAVLVLGQMPEASRLFHMYAEALHTVGIEPESHVVYLRYSLTKEKLAPLDESGDESYLIDEIYRRTVKMHHEREYCMRFTRRIVQIDVIDVKIEVYESGKSPNLCRDPIAYRLQQVGYPGSGDNRIEDVVPDRTLVPTGRCLYKQLCGEV